MKIDKRTALTAIPAICGAGGFIANLLMSKDENEEIAKRAAEILEEKQNSSEE